MTDSEAQRSLREFEARVLRTTYELARIEQLEFDFKARVLDFGAGEVSDDDAAGEPRQAA